MNRFILISSKTEGFISYAYNRQQYLVDFRVCSWDMTEAKLRWLLEQLANCLTFQQVRQWAIANEFKLVKVDTDLSFNRFYEEYDVKRNKIDAEKLWNKLGDEERQYTLFNHEAYQRYCKRNPWYTKMYPDTYLSKHRKDDWDKIEGKNKKEAR